MSEYPATFPLYHAPSEQTSSFLQGCHPSPSKMTSRRCLLKQGEGVTALRTSSRSLLQRQTRPCAMFSYAVTTASPRLAPGFGFGGLFFFFQTCPQTVKLPRVSNRQPPVRTPALSPVSPCTSQKKGRGLVSNQRLKIPNSTLLEVRRKICRDAKQIPV